MTRPATSGQRDLYLAGQNPQPSSSYNTALILSVDSEDFDPDRLFAAAIALAAASPSLRLRLGIDEGSGTITQWISGDDPPAERIDLTAISDEDVADVALRCADRFFETDEGPLTAFSVLHGAHGLSHLVAVNHHLAIDGPSYESLGRRMGDALARTLEPHAENDYFALVDDVLARESAASADLFWRDLTLPDRTLRTWLTPRGGVRDGRRLVELDEQQTEGVTLAAEASGTSLFSHLVAAVHLAAPADPGLGSVCAATSVRPRNDLGAITGYFINEVPLLAVVDPAEPVTRLAARQAPQWREALRRRFISYRTAEEQLALSSAVGAMTPGSVLVSFRNSPRRLTRRLGGATVGVDLIPRYPSAKADMSVRFFRDGPRLSVEAQWGAGIPPGLGPLYMDTLEQLLLGAAPVS